PIPMPNPAKKDFIEYAPYFGDKGSPSPAKKKDAYSQRRLPHIRKIAQISPVEFIRSMALTGISYLG
ncbi:MAG TPA: hypothetical protein VFP71_05345, partial [Candidatus Angelobacter sp.]|nr:hypothetical protein [Candidatus Angelobacter sp.]